jgi:lycopene cyclase domain-containing protein
MFNYYYLATVSILLVIAVALEIIYHEHLFSFWKERLIWVLLSLGFGIPWDYYAIPNGHWVFPGEGILGVTIFGFIPIEELLWFLIVPYFWLTVYHTIHILNDKK